MRSLRVRHTTTSLNCILWSVHFYLPDTLTTNSWWELIGISP